MNKTETIRIQGARVNNLKNITVDIPIHKLVVITGVSGSGKTSLAFDTLYAEGQRRYVESLSSYARQFLGRINKPDVDMITGISPAIAIDNRVTVSNSRSTVGTSTEIYEYLKLLFARLGKTYSPVSGEEVKQYNEVDIVNEIINKDIGTLAYICFTTNTDEQNIVYQIEAFLEQGYSRLLILQGRKGNQKIIIAKMQDVLEDKILKAKLIKKGELLIMVDRLKINDKDIAENNEQMSRLVNSTETALYEGEGRCVVAYDYKTRIELREYSNKFEADGIQFEIPVPDLFSFNSPYGACPECEGFGEMLGVDEDLVIPDKSLSLYDNAVACWRGEKMQEWKNQVIANAEKVNFPIHRPIEKLTNEQYKLLWCGCEYFEGINDFFKYLEKKVYKIQYRVMASRFRGYTKCSTCSGKRLRKEALYVKFRGKTIDEFVTSPIKEIHKYFQELELTDYESKVALRVINEIRQRLDFLVTVGLGYLNLDRISNTLSGGESQRINLSAALGSNLTGSLYVLDEPSVGLHSRDTQRLIKSLKSLRDLGNTVVVVEHDEEIIRSADYVIDIGPHAGRLGGEIVYAGTVPQMLKAKTLTAKYLNGELEVVKQEKKKIRKVRDLIRLTGCKQHNLKNISVDFPLNMLTVVAGVSGSGKTTLVNEILYPALKRYFGENTDKPGAFEKLTGDLNVLTGVESVTQDPIGRSSRSNAITYIGAFDDIRTLMSQQKLSIMRGYKPGFFSFNVAGGRCEECQGEGYKTIEMQFLADVKLVCEECGGKKYKEEVLDIKYKNYNIYELLEMTIEQAYDFFALGESSIEKRIMTKLKPLIDVGLGYVKMGQSSATLSGGEAQRVKLASFLISNNNHKLFIFDEPTTGLHFHDISKLLKAIDNLIEQGNSVIVIEHNKELIKAADYIIELGPEGGEEGGYLLNANPNE